MVEDSFENTKLIELGFIDKNKRIRVFEKECPSINHLMVYDIRVSGKEDYVYAHSPDLQYNLRKGHTIVEVYDQEDFTEKKYSVVARKGPRRYYSLRSEDLESDQDYYKLFDVPQPGGEVEYEEIYKGSVFRNYSLALVHQALAQGKKIEVYRSIL